MHEERTRRSLLLESGPWWLELLDSESLAALEPEGREDKPGTDAGSEDVSPAGGKGRREDG